MAHEIRLGGPSVCYPDVAIRDGLVHVVAGPIPWQWWRYTLDGALVSHQTQACGYFPVTDGRQSYAHDGLQYLQWPGGTAADPILRHARPTGNRPIGISPDGGIVAHQEAGSPHVYCGSVITGAGAARPTGIWKVREDGTPIMADDARQLWPYAAGMCFDGGPVCVAEGESGIEGECGSARFTLWPGRNTKEPRCAVDGPHVAIVCWGDDGCWLWIGTFDDLDALGVQAPPVMLPAIGHPIDVGYFYRDTSAIQYGGDNPAAPATISVVIDALALPAEPCDGKPVRMIVDAGCLFELARHPEWWDRWAGTYVAAEGDEALLTRMAETVRLMATRLMLPARPIVSYTAGTLYPHALAPTDIIGVQAYAQVGESPDQAQARVAADLARVAHRRVALIAQAYDRADPYWTDARLAALQPVWWDLARTAPHVEMILLFSDGRRGGTRDHEAALRPYHKAMVQRAVESHAA
jgi:hypothetical protein